MVEGKAALSQERWGTLSPILYDWLATSTRAWPSLACRWGPATQSDGGDASRTRQRVYYSDQTDGTSAPNTLIAAYCDVAKPRHTPAKAVARGMDASVNSSAFRRGKTIVHPGEVNKIRELHGVAPAELVATHSDSKDVYVWNVGTQPDRAGEGRGARPSRPDALLVGHTQEARYALATACATACVASGGEDAAVCLWRLADLDNGGALLRRSAAADGRTSLNSGGLGGLGGGGGTPVLSPLRRFDGHTKTVEDVSFHPANDSLLCSVGDDSSLRFWDAAAASCAAALAGAHGREDVHCCDWSAAEEHLVATGGADNCVRVFDRRKAGGDAAAACVRVLRGHSQVVNALQWCPDARGVLASAASDGLVNVWDLSRAGAAAGGDAPELLFQHPGHGGSPVLDLHWSPAQPWTLLSCSENDEAGGGILQAWRMLDWLYRPEADVLAEAEAHRAAILAPADAEDDSE